MMGMSGVNRRVLLLAPSEGLGGGIERFASGIEEVLVRAAVPCQRLNLRHSGQPLTLAARIRFVRSVRRAVWTSDDPVRVVVAHANLLPAVSAVSRLPAYHGTAVIVHGGETWTGRRPRGRWWL